jgi:hypothetical protein
MKANIESGQLWKDLRKWNSQGYLIGYALDKRDEHGNFEEGADQQGIIYNHAYGMLRIEDLTQSHGLQMIYSRNPWGSQ